jgi:hypothetical protein
MDAPIKPGIYRLPHDVVNPSGYPSGVGLRRPVLPAGKELRVEFKDDDGEGYLIATCVHGPNDVCALAFCNDGVWEPSKAGRGLPLALLAALAGLEPLPPPDTTLEDLQRELGVVPEEMLWALFEHVEAETAGGIDMDRAMLAGLVRECVLRAKVKANARRGR